MKIVDVPQLGKLGLTVTWPGRNGLIRRIKVTPRNPRTLAQEQIRSYLTAQSRAWGALSDAQQEAWRVAAANLRSQATLGQSGPLTGSQLFMKINCSNLVIGSPAVTEPPAVPTIEPLAISALVITNAAGLITLKLTAASPPPDGTMLRGCAPCSAGIHRLTSPRYLGTLGSPVGGAIDISTLYTNRFGSPAVGQRVIVQVNANISGFEGPRLTFSARVPAAA